MPEIEAYSQKLHDLQYLMIVVIFLSVVLIGAAYIETFFWVFLLVAIAVVATFLFLKHHSGI